MNIIETNLQFNGLSNRSKTERIILHHSACTSCSAEQVHKWHLNNGWAGAGYHFLVRKNGDIYRLRPEGTVGSHAYGSNYNSIGICAEGDFMSEEMQYVQANAIKELIAYLKNKYAINVVQKHKEVCSTSCPGNNYPFKNIVNGVIANISVEKKELIGKVSEVQRYINKTYGLNIAVDNIYGNETKKALVIALQREINVADDGMFGNITKSHCPCIKIGAKNNIVYLIQAMLNCHSFDLVLDGDFGTKTNDAVKEFQARNFTSKNEIDGIVGPNTFYKLFK